MISPFHHPPGGKKCQFPYISKNVGKTMCKSFSELSKSRKEHEIGKKGNNQLLSLYGPWPYGTGPMLWPYGPMALYSCFKNFVK